MQKLLLRALPTPGPDFVTPAFVAVLVFLAADADAPGDALFNEDGVDLGGVFIGGGVGCVVGWDRCLLGVAVGGF